MYVLVCACTCACVCVCMCMCVKVFVCVHLCAVCRAAHAVGTSSVGACAAVVLVISMRPAGGNTHSCLMFDCR